MSPLGVAKGDVGAVASTRAGEDGEAPKGLLAAMNGELLPPSEVPLLANGELPSPKGERDGTGGESPLREPRGATGDGAVLPEPM